METVLLGIEQNKLAKDCQHFCEITLEAFKTEKSTKEFLRTEFSLECYVCERNTQPLWTCMKSDCKKTFCSSPKLFHALCHYSKDTKHCVFENLLTSDLWCFDCKSRLSLETLCSDVGKEERIIGCTGLANLGNSSFMNAVLQALSNVPQISFYFLENLKFLSSTFASENTEIGEVSSIFQELMLNLWSPGQQNWIVPDRIHAVITKYYPIFKCDIQQDSHELLCCLMKLIHEELTIFSTDDAVKSNEISTSETSNKSIISEVFEGCLSSFVKCLNCKKIFSQEESFQTLSLSIPTDAYFKYTWCLNTPHNQKWLYKEDKGWFSSLLQGISSIIFGPAVNLHDCLASFFSINRFKEENKLNCSNCGKQSVCIKRWRLLSVPEVLCIHIKLFTNVDGSLFKGADKIQFPLEGLDMRYYMKNDVADSYDYTTRYTLISVICHKETNETSGHFTCYCLNYSNNQWYHYDDEQVTRVNSEVVKKVQAYILFYSMNYQKYKQGCVENLISKK
ncbi:ubiquitin carboxyl-terminal hydrolase 33-like isoform X2 [Rhodnius prolixus]|uniref:ubiquitin carboxyl-terminal hydrolase 33-like isoform X2 n=1 Tax=Rhodnius prolixus TaxID=13249 RepID=UPI003D18DC9B